MVLKIISKQDVPIKVMIKCEQLKEELNIEPLGTKNVYIDNRIDLVEIRFSFLKKMFFEKIFEIMFDTFNCILFTEEKGESFININAENYVSTKLHILQDTDVLEIRYQSILGTFSEQEINVGKVDRKDIVVNYLFDEESFDRKINYIYRIIVLLTFICSLSVLVFGVYSMVKQYAQGIWLCLLVFVCILLSAFVKAREEKENWKDLKEKIIKDINALMNI